MQIPHPRSCFDVLAGLDFESFYSSEYGLRALTTEGYVRDPRFEMIGCAARFGPEPSRWYSAAELAERARQVDWSRVALLAHHAHFDGLIAAHYLGIRPAFWFDTLSMARAIHGTEVGGSLERLALHYGVGHKGREVKDAIGKRRVDFSPAELAAYGRYSCNDLDLAMAILRTMLARGFPAKELWHIDTTIRMFTEPTFILDEPRLKRAHAAELERKADLLKRVGADRSLLMSNDKFAALLQSMGVDPPRKISGRTKQETWAFAKNDHGMRDLLEHEDDRVRWLAEARVGVKSTINETRMSRFLRAGAGGRALPVYLKYAAAHTYRWGGGDKMNFQNLQRGGELRACLMAPDGRVLVVADSAAIEARGVAWLAGQTDLIADFKANTDLYSKFASRVYGRPVNRKRKSRAVAGVGGMGDWYLFPAPDDWVNRAGAPLRDKNGDAKLFLSREEAEKAAEYAPDLEPGYVGKTSILGLGYGLGWAKFADTLLKGPMGAPPIQFSHEVAAQLGVNIPGVMADLEWVDIDDPQAVFSSPFFQDKRRRGTFNKYKARLSREDLAVHCAASLIVVQTYRRTYQEIPKLWKMMDQLIQCMLNGTEAAFGPGGILRTKRNACVLPSGLELRYPELRYSHPIYDEETGEEIGGGYSYLGGKGGKERVRLYGGSMTENVVQALARIVVADQILNCRLKYGYHVVTTTHDEGVFVVPESEGERALERVIAEMCTPPEWALDWPVFAEGDVAKSYGEAK